MSLVDLKKIKKPEVEVEDINNMTKEELLYHIITTFEQNYTNENIARKAEWSECSDFYKGVSQGYWECVRVVKELVGRLNNDSVDS